MKSFSTDIATIVRANVDVLKETFSAPGIIASLDAIAQCVSTAVRNGNKVLLCGNGGSAADAQHIAAEFIGRYKIERKSYPAIALTTDSSILTCVGNDYSFQDIFKRQVEGLGVKGDVLIAISTSGNSENVMRAVTAAKQLGMTTVSVTGGTGGKLKPMTDLNFNVPSSNTPYVQSGHEIGLHTICEVVERELAQ